jgi:hypothetical protein
MKTSTFSFQACRWICVVAFLYLLAVGMPHVQPACATCPSFNSGSTGLDGQFNPSGNYVPPGSTINGNTVTVPLPTNGVLNFSSVYIETNWTVRFTRNVLNTPVFILAQSTVMIKGTVDVSGADSPSTSLDGGSGGPGGFDGGGASSIDASRGCGPGGGWNDGHAGYAFPGNETWRGAAQPYGVIDMLPMIGGSGGGASRHPYPYEGGTGGGGAILIAASGTLTCDGKIAANGGWNGDSGRGSGGSIRLMAQTIAGEGFIQANGGAEWGSVGRIRLEACANKRVTITSPPATYGEPGVIFLNPNPTIKITGITGQTPPWPPTGSLTTPDVNLPTGFSNPGTITVSASNIALNTTFKVIVTPVYGTNLVATGSLSGGDGTFSWGSVLMDVYTDRVWRVNALIDYIPRP